MEGVIRYIKRIDLESNKGERLSSENIRNYEEAFNTVRFKTPVKIDGLERGFVGDIVWTGVGRHLEDESVYESCDVTKNVLCVRINKKVDNDEFVMEWEYEFLKS